MTLTARVGRSLDVMSQTYRDPGERTCVRCEVPVVPVTVIDHGHANLFVGLAYTAERAPEKSAWTGVLSNASGVLRAHVCPRCQLVAWYAHAGDPVERR